MDGGMEGWRDGGGMHECIYTHICVYIYIHMVMGIWSLWHWSVLELSSPSLPHLTLPLRGVCLPAGGSKRRAPSSYVATYRHTNAHVHIHILRVCVCMHVCMHACMHACMHVSTYIHTYMYIWQCLERGVCRGTPRPLLQTFVAGLCVEYCSLQ